MSGNLRAATVLFDGTETIANGAGTDSKAANPGPANDVAILIENTGAQSATITFQAAANDGKLASGRNPDFSAISWYDLIDKADVANASKIQLVVAAGAKLALDLSPFAPPYFRVHAAAAAATTTLKAYLVANG
jgi:hypothetical protein